MEHKREYFLIYLFILLLFTFYLIVLSIYFKYFVYIFRTQYQNTRFSLLATFLRVNRHIYIHTYIYKACWSEHLLELLSAYNATCSAVTGYSPYYLLFGRWPRILVDFQFPTHRDPPHTTSMAWSVATMQERLKEALEVARQLTCEEAARQRCYYDKTAGVISLQPGDVVMVRTDRFVGKRKVKD